MSLSSLHPPIPRTGVEVAHYGVAATHIRAHVVPSYALHVSLEDEAVPAAIIVAQDLDSDGDFGSTFSDEHHLVWVATIIGVLERIDQRLAGRAVDECLLFRGSHPTLHF